MPKHWLITGGCGFIGTSLIAHLLKEHPDIRIRVLDNLSVGTREDLSDVSNFVEADISRLTAHVTRAVELIVGDIRDYNVCHASCEGIDVIVHLAANTGVGPSVADPRADMESNVIGTFNMLEASRQKGVEKFIFASSGAPIGEVEPPITEDKPAKPVSPYGASKLAGEGYCSAYFRTFGLKTVSLRFGNVYGPRSKHKSSVVAKFIKQALAGKPLEIYGDGNQTRDFIYIDDLIQAICLAVNPKPCRDSVELGVRSKETGCVPPSSHALPIAPYPLPSSIYGEIYQIATHKETTVNEITALIKEIVEKEKGLRVAIKHGESRLGDVKRNYSDISKARKMLGFEPKVVLSGGLTKTYEYFIGKEQL